MPISFKRRTLLGLSAIAFLAAVGPGFAQSAEGGDAVFAVAGFPSGLDVALSGGRGSTVTHQILDTLTFTNPTTQEIEPYLATSWEVSDDAKTFTFKLRDDVTFSDGTAFNAQSVKNNFDKLVEFNGQAVTDTLVRSALSTYSASRVVDPYTVEITFTAPQLGFLRNASDPYLGFYADATLALTSDERIAGDLIGSGPFVFGDVVRNESVKLLAREDYNWAPASLGHDGRAALNSVTYLAVPESGVRAGLLASGQADFIDDVAVEDEPIVLSSGTLVSKVAPGLLPGFRQNPYSRFGSDLAVRQAFTKAIDRAQLRDVLLSAETSQLVSGVIGTSTPLFADESALLAHDPDGARAILEADGWTLGADGIYEKDGERLSLKITFSPNSLVSSRLELELIQAQVAQVGIELELVPMTPAEWSASIQGIAKAGRENAVYDFLSGSGPSKDVSFLVGLFKNTNPALGGAEQPELEAAANGLAAATTEDERSQAASALQELLARDGYWIPIKQITKVVGVRNGAEGFVLDAYAAPLFYTVTVD